MLNNEVVLQIKNLSKTYKGEQYEVHALRNISFEVNLGEMIAIMGTSGSGKSTLLHVLGALDAPDKGDIFLHGKKQSNIFQEPYATHYRRDQIGFIFQSFHLLKDLSVEENIGLPLVLKGDKNNVIKQRVDVILQQVGLTEWKKHRPVQLSGGQQQRVAIARALITNPPIVLADELTGNLDFNMTNDILSILVDMKELRKQSIIVVTHDPYVATFADRVLFFHDGEIVDTYGCGDENDMNNILAIFRKIMEQNTNETVK
ncbi:ABC transporter ATP-binding protein [Bacillus massiliigorillae]|uniref:ABC transporter ATP-binding protein n=1 Tax=Bacillus massiliigorillae TaxID=1243664 RepID=UPI00039E97C4|nr:ABC transporter ATP-binding protein [Bacillus massiliigorillae]